MEKTKVNKQSLFIFWLDWRKYGAVSYSFSCKNDPWHTIYCLFDSWSMIFNSNFSEKIGQIIVLWTLTVAGQIAQCGYLISITLGSYTKNLWYILSRNFHCFRQIESFKIVWFITEIKYIDCFFLFQYLIFLGTPRSTGCVPILPNIVNWEAWPPLENHQGVSFARNGLP